MTQLFNYWIWIKTSRTSNKTFQVSEDTAVLKS